MKDSLLEAVDVQPMGVLSDFVAVNESAPVKHEYQAPNLTSSSLPSNGSLMILLASLGFIALLVRLVYVGYFHPLAKFPGPWPAKFGNLYWYSIHLRGRSPWVNHEWHKKYGPVVRIGPNHLSFCDHSAVKTIYGFGSDTVPSMIKDPRFFTPEVDHSMNVINEIDKEEHSRMRRMMSAAFSTSNLFKQEDIFVRRTDELLKQIDDRETEDGKKDINIVSEFCHVTYNIMGEMAFGDSWDLRLKEQKEHPNHWADVIVKTTFMNDFMRAVVCIPGLFSLLEKFPPAYSKKTLYRQAEYAIEHTQARLKLDTDRRDVVHYIVNAKGPAATPKEIASHFNVIMMAGTVTTATFLSSALYYLAHNLNALGRLQHELRETFGSIDAINSKQLLNCVYLNAVIEEGLRVFPPAGAAHLSRIVPKGGCMISGHFVAEGTRVSVHSWSIVRDAANFHNPEQFIPERWIPSSPEAQKGDKLDQSLPFSYGPRVCLGKNLAYMEMRMIMARLFWQYDIAWLNTEEVDWERDAKGYTLWARPELRAVFKKHVE